MRPQDLRTVPDCETLEADVCIVGTGPAGVTLAEELSGRGFRVLILESGDVEADAWPDSLNEIESVGAPRVIDQTIVRNRIVGGASHTWWGKSATFDDMDFAARDWVPDSGWPITRSSLAPYFERSRSFLGLAVADNNEPEGVVRSTVRSAGRSGSPDSPFVDYGWTHSRDQGAAHDCMRFGPRLLRAPLTDTRLLVNATVTHIDTDPSGAVVDRLEVTGRDLRPRWVRARATVLCAGGIENARLLLASRRIVPHGVGNANDRVGRYLMDHLRGPIGHWEERDSLVVQKAFSNFHVTVAGEKSVIIPGLTPTAETQRREGLLNSAIWMAGTPATSDPWESMRRIWRGEAGTGASLRNVATNLPLVIGGVKSRAIDHRSVAKRLELTELHVILEQRPDPESRITLSNRVDALGVPISVIDWRISDQEAHTARTVAGFALTELGRRNLPLPRLTSQMVDPLETFHLRDVAHPTGTTRMSVDPRHGVVDTDLAVHGVAGLFIAGSSVFPTNGHANPTQMIVSLAIRLADHLSGTLRSAASTPTTTVAA